MTSISRGPDHGARVSSFERIIAQHVHCFPRRAFCISRHRQIGCPALTGWARLAAKVHNSPDIMSGPVNKLLTDVTFTRIGTSGVGSSHCGDIWRAILRDMGRDMGLPETKSTLAALGYPLSCPTDQSGPVFLQRLAGTRVYMGGAFEGSGDCMHAIFVEISPRSPGRPAVRRIFPPQGYTGPCIGVTSGLGKVMGVPSYVENGDVNGGSLDYFIRVTPWTGHNWGPACKVTFHWRHRYRGKVQYCARQSPCQAAKAASAGLARRYVAYRHAASPREVVLGTGTTVPDLDPAAMSARGLAAVARAWKMLSRQCAANGGLPAYMCARYPSRKGGERLYSTFEYFPLKLGRRLYVGGMGHLGAGREYPPILLSIYAVPGRGQGKLSGLVGIWINPCCVTGAPPAVITHGAAADVNYRSE